MKKFFKALLYIVLVIVVLVIIAAVFINSRGIPSYPVNDPDFIAQADSSELVRGKKLATMLCASCHANPETGSLTGRKMDDAPEFGMLYSQNITQDTEYGIGNWTDGEILYSLRTGILPNGRYTPPYMAKLPYMSDDDISAIIAFLRSDDPMVAAANVPDQPCKPSMLTKVLSQFAFKPLPFPEEPIEEPDTTDKVEWGRYLTYNLDCWTCHSPSFQKINIAKPEMTEGFLSGGNPALKDREGNQVLSLNITPDKQTGIGEWNEHKFVQAVKYGVVEGDKPLRFPMPLYVELSDGEAKAIFAYLQSVPAITNNVSRNFNHEN